MCGCGTKEVTSDNNHNGTLDSGDCIPDACPADPDKYVKGVCGCGVPDIDSDGDGTYDCNDQCPYDKSKTSRGICGCFQADSDSNGNGTADCLEHPGGEQVYYYHNDPSGTPLAMTDFQGNTVWKASYLPFGREYSIDRAIISDRRFVGNEKDVETGLNYFSARYLDTGSGRFLSPDPVRAVDVESGEVNARILGDPQGLNLYGYAQNDPIDRIDLKGLAWSFTEQNGTFDDSPISEFLASPDMVGLMMATPSGRLLYGGFEYLAGLAKLSEEAVAVSEGELALASKGLTNAEVRTWYNTQVRSLDTSGALTRETAEGVHDARNLLKQQARDMMADRSTAAQLAKDHPLQPFEYYVEKYSKQGLEGEALWKRIIEGGTTPNATVNKQFGIK